MSARAHFPIKACCTKCGHQNQVFIDSEAVAKDVHETMKFYVLKAWQPLMVRRIMVGFAFFFLVGLIFGRLL